MFKGYSYKNDKNFSTGWFSEIWSSYNTSLMVAGIILLCSAFSLLPLFFFNKQQKSRAVKAKS